jgi:hypothetical protein
MRGSGSGPWTASDRLELVVADDGQGFEPQYVAAPVASRNSFGRASMRERAESLDGELQLESQPGSGTRVIVSIPLKSRSGRISRGSRAWGEVGGVTLPSKSVVSPTIGGRSASTAI